ncbi:glycosyltransferase family 2 protein [Spirosoma radiotolerans]|uniref:Glycosyl transferase family 2 n=1 Tax=Spirosoma radiotolerans TaxID=1379870 RepID=A0A0E3ZTV1_9BACT|nr:glycosyltransferase [Spirosoma radiotolerans]AKD54785.1 glycosyl transferase family 2 [Spirosoma radiotolerans]
MEDITIVIVTRNRIDTLLWTLDKLTNLPQKPPIIVVDNASTDGTPDRVKAVYPQVTVLALDQNKWCAARNDGVELAKTSLVSFCDDDSFWEPDALTKAATYFRKYPHLGVLASKILIGESQEVDGVCDAMKNSPLTDPRPLPGPAVLGFVCCAVVVRREAYLSVGGFDSRFAIAGEERMFSVDMRTKGWSLAYADDMVAHHYPSPLRNIAQRTRHITRDTLWYYWLRRPAYYAFRHTTLIFKQMAADINVRKGFWDALKSAPSILVDREVVPQPIEEQILKIESFY